VTGNDRQRRLPSDRRFWALVGLVCLVFVAIWLSTVGETLTHDEAIYIDIAEHPFHSSFYPGEVFLRHPPLGLALLSAWNGLGLMARAWPLVWTLGGLLVLGDAIRRSGGSPAWLLPVVLAAPAAIPLVTVTLYPPMFAFLSLAAWGWAADRRDIEVAGWNLAVFTHELALLVLACVLAPRAVAIAREGWHDWRAWGRLVQPYPAALAWGVVMVAYLATPADGRGQYLATLDDPAPNVASIVRMTAWVGLVILATAGPLLIDPRRGTDEREHGITLATAAAVVAAPFYRYVLPLLPTLATLRARDPPEWWGRRGWAVLAGAALVATGLSLGAIVTGQDTVNAANTPGLVDHEDAVGLIEPGETVVVRSTPSFARVLEDRGWRIAATAATGPSTVEMTRDGDRIVMHRAETYERLHEVDSVDAVVFPTSWTNVPGDLPQGPWVHAGEAGGATRWEPR
jgi:hypothetical protein